MKWPKTETRPAMIFHLGTWQPSSRKVIPVGKEPSPTITVQGVRGAVHSKYSILCGGSKREVMKEKKEKPPYQIESMSQISKVRGTNGFKVISTFSGAGGSCLGFEMAGLDVVWSSEFVEAAREVHKLNFPHCIVDPRDIRNVSPEEILEAAGLKKREVDVLNGSPPCASFSTAGQRQKSWGKVKGYSETKQRTDDLFFEFARLIEGIKPKTFVAENVPGLNQGKAKGYLQIIYKKLVSCGYAVKIRELDAQWMGVPQARKRIIFVGVRKDLPFEFIYPKPLQYRYTVADACPWINHYASVQHGFFKGSNFSTDERPTHTVATAPDSAAYYKHVVTTDDVYPGDLDADLPEADISRYAIGQEWKNVMPGKQSKKYFNLMKTHPDKPSPTVTQVGGNITCASVVCHDAPRKFTIPELKRICGFPDDFVLTGSYRQRWERLGRAVPPPMMKAIAQSLCESVLTPLKDREP
jgi:DNA (cytosine-5)-methyltransferase 1